MGSVTAVTEPDSILGDPSLTHLAAARSAVVAADDETRVAADAGTPPGTIARLVAICDQAEGLLLAAEPGLIPQDSLEALRAAVAPLEDLARQALEDPSVLVSLDAQLSTVLRALMPIAVASPVLRDWSEISRSQIGGAIVERANELAAFVGDAASQQEAALADIAAARAAAASELDTAIQVQTERVNDLANNVSQQQSAAASLLTEMQSALDEQIKEQQRATEASAADWAEQMEAALLEAHAVRDSMNTLYEVLSQTGVSGAQRTESARQGRAAFGWQLATVAFGLLAAGAALWAVLATAASSEPSWVAATTKTVLALAVGGVAAYAASQAAQHRRREEEAKRIELDLVTFDPFIRELSEERQEYLRAMFVERAFLRPMPTTYATRTSLLFSRQAAASRNGAAADPAGGAE